MNVEIKSKIKKDVVEIQSRNELILGVLNFRHASIEIVKKTEMVTNEGARSLLMNVLKIFSNNVKIAVNNVPAAIVNLVCNSTLFDVEFIDWVLSGDVIAFPRCQGREM
ncbi:hypothetical protein [Chromobacterium haemolyticum]|uniref:hypothetical protein n=1 Tax=Chromobacterium haemolyticum TaxID=394935 RepID=UPI001130BA8E|nr:hypothetical protein [Chromobacterium haemolyticum]